MRDICGCFSSEAIPGLLLGTFVLHLIGQEGGNPVVIILLGILLAASSSVTFAPRAAESRFRPKESALVAMARAPHRGGIRILLRRAGALGQFCF